MTIATDSGLSAQIDTYCGAGMDLGELFLDPSEVMATAYLVYLSVLLFGVARQLLTAKAEKLCKRSLRQLGKQGHKIRG